MSLSSIFQFCYYEVPCYSGFKSFVHHTYTHTHTHTHTHTQPHLELLEFFSLFWVILHDDMILFQKFIIVGTLCSLSVLSLWPLHSGRFLIKALIISSLPVSVCSFYCFSLSDIESPWLYLSSLFPLAMGLFLLSNLNSLK